MAIGFCTSLIGTYIYVNTALFNLALDEVKTVEKIINENKISQEVSQEFFDMF